MDQLKLQPSWRLDEAGWLAGRLRPFGSGVASIVPAGFPAYLRILHPATGVNNELLRWADVAAKRGRTMHRLAQFHAINRPNAAVSGDAVTPPRTCNLHSDLLTALCEVLAKHTNATDSCRFCLWDGYGWLRENEGSTVEFTPTGASGQASTRARYADSLSPVLSAAALNTIRVRLPYRNYLLFEGPLEAATELGWKIAGEHFVPQSPNLFWPDDHAWCVASEIDLFCTLVAGSKELVESLMADPRLEVWRVFADDPVHADSDDKNR